MHTHNKKANIICLSNQLWNYPLPTNKKHVMARLAQRGFNVLFVDPPINTGRLFLRQLLSGKWSFKRLLTWNFEAGGLTVFSPLNFLPSNRFMSRLFIKKITKLAKAKFDKNLKTVLWIYHLEIDNLFDYIDHLPHDVTVYDCVDNYAGFPKYNAYSKKEKINRQEELLAKKVDIVFATAPGLVDKLVRFNTKTFFTPNVGDYEKFSKAKDLVQSIPLDITDIARPRIGFYGAVDDYKFDLDLLKKVATDYPNYSFVVIGSIALKDRESSEKELGLKNFSNIYFLGQRDYNMLPAYCAGFDAFIIPYKLNDYTVGGCFPVKFHEVLAAGLPTVVTNLPAYRPFEDVCYISKSHNEFSQNIRRAIEEDSDQKRKDRELVAKQNDWDGKVESMVHLIDTQVMPL